MSPRAALVATRRSARRLLPGMEQIRFPFANCGAQHDAATHHSTSCVPRWTTSQLSTTTCVTDNWAPFLSPPIQAATSEAGESTGAGERQDVVNRVRAEVAKAAVAKAVKQDRPDW